MDLQAAVQKVTAEAKRAKPRATVDLALPIYEGRFGARFGVLARERIEQMGSDPDAETDLAAGEIIADACRCIVAMGDDGYEPLRHADGRTVRFDEEFAESLGFTLTGNSAAHVVLECFRLEPEEEGEQGPINSVELHQFGGRLLEWMQDTSMPIDGEIAGKSPNGRPSSPPATPPPATSIPAA